MKKALSLLFVIMLSLLCAIPVFAEGDPSVTIDLPRQSFSVGDSITIRVNVVSPVDIGSLTASVTYDSSLLTFVSGDNATVKNGVIWIECAGNGDTAAANLTFTASSEGTASINVASCFVTAADGSQTDIGTTTSDIQIVQSAQTTTSQEQSTSILTTTTQTTQKGQVPSQGVLVDLKTDKGTLIPPFMSSIHEYTLTVPYEVDKVEIDGITASENDKIWYTGNPDCVVGKNLRTIKVTDVTGKETVYTITIIRLDKDEKATSASSMAVQTKSSETPDKDDSIGKVSKVSREGIDLKGKLMPALYIALIVLVVALVIVLIWIKNKFKGKKKKDDEDEKKTQKQRSKIKVTNTKGKKK